VVNGVEDGHPHNRTPLLTEAIDRGSSFPERFAGTGKWFAGVAECFVRNVPAHPPGKPSSRRRPARDLAHDRNDLLHDITAGAADSTSQQIPHRGADFRFGVIRARKLPIVLI
jgi:hypothetical protein